MFSSLSDFIGFWVNCVVNGATVGGGVFAIAEIACALLWFFYRRKEDENTTKAREDRIGIWAKRIFIILFFVSTILVAPYVQFKVEREEKRKSQEALNDKSPKLNGFIDQTLSGEEFGKTNSLVLLQVTVGNSGHSPSIAENYELRVILTNRTSVKADLIDFPDEYKLNALGSNSITPFALKRSELISEKTSKAIQPGEAPRGWIAFKVPGVLLSQYAPTNTTIVLSFLDISGAKIFVTNGFWKGTPAREMEALRVPKTLPGSVNLVSQADNQLGGETNVPRWLPPELPAGCSNVTVFFGGQGFTYSRLFAGISSESTGTKVAIKDLPDEFLKDSEKIPNYWPRNREMWIRREAVQQDFGGKTVNYPITPFVVSNRLFVEVEIPFLNAKRRIVMSDEFDMELSRLPRAWDRNYSTNSYVYEVVNEQTNPVLQVFYTRPDEVHVNGIFLVDSNAILKSFGEPPELFTVMSYAFVNLTNMQEITNASVFLGTNSVGEVFTNSLYHWKFPTQKAIFKYPSNRNPSVFAN